MNVVAIAMLVLLPLFLAEFGPWCGWLAKKSLPCAARLRCGRGDRATVRSEEWQYHLNEIPAPISQLVYALAYLVTGLALAAQRKLRKTRWRSNINTALLLVNGVGADIDENVDIDKLAWQNPALCARPYSGLFP